MEPTTAVALASAAKSSDTDSGGGVDMAKVGESMASIPLTSAVKMGVALVPGKYEREQKKQYEAIRARGAAGHGLSATELAKHRGVAESSTARAKANLASQMSRGASSAGGVGGQAFEQMRQSAREIEGKELQEKSDIRTKDLDYMERMTRLANEMRNQMMAQKAEALGMGIEAYQEAEPALTAAGETVRGDVAEENVALQAKIPPDK